MKETETKLRANKVGAQLQKLLGTNEQSDMHEVYLRLSSESRSNEYNSSTCLSIVIEINT